MTDLEILSLLVKAKELGIGQEHIDAFKAGSIVPRETVQDRKPEDLIKPLSTFDEMDEELIRYWATPFYDELIAKREAQKQRKLTGDGEINGDNRPI